MGSDNGQRGSSSLSPGGVSVGGESQLLEEPGSIVIDKRDFISTKGGWGGRGGGGSYGSSEQLKSCFHPF